MNGPSSHGIGSRFARKTVENLVNNIVLESVLLTSEVPREISESRHFEAVYRTDDSQKYRKNGDLEDFFGRETPL